MLASRGLQVSDAAAGTRRAAGGYNWSSPLSLYGTQVFSAPVSHYYTVPSLAAFLRDSHVLEALLGLPVQPSPAAAAAAAARPTPPVHVQTLTRVPTILKFLAQVRALGRGVSASLVICSRCNSVPRPAAWRRVTSPWKPILRDGRSRGCICSGSS